MPTRLLSIKDAAKHFNFPRDKLYRLVEERACPYVELKSLSGTTSKKINTQSFADWLDQLARDQKVI
ncbi:MAG: hypothetical protein GX352_03125 [Clostridiales bacterium]|nr:hypothetical protein [Clostridiales bacterium]